MSSATTAALTALQHELNEQFKRETVPPALAGTEFIKEDYWQEIPCKKCGDKEYMELKKIGDESVYVCPDLHRKPKEAGIYYTVQTKAAIQELLGNIEIEDIERSGRIYFGTINGTQVAIVPGKYDSNTLSNLESYLRGYRHQFVIAFEEDTRTQLDEIIGRLGGISAAVSPPSLERKFNHFESLIEARTRIEETYTSSGDDVPTELIEEVHDNPHRVASKLINFEKIEGTSDQRDEMEQLCAISFAQLAQFPLKPLGMSKTGIRVPDGLGFIFNEAHEHSTMLMLDSKSVSAKTRPYPKITESEGPQYRKYLEIADDISTDENAKNKVLVFIAPEFNESKIEDFLDELERSPFDEFKVVFLRLDGLSSLLYAKHTLVSDRASRLNIGRWQTILETMFTDPDYEKDKRDYKFAEKNAILMDSDLIHHHLDNKITNQKNKDDVLERVAENFIDYSPHDP